MEGMELMIYIVIYSIVTAILGIPLFKLSPKLPLFSTIQIFLIAIPSCWFLYTADWDFSSESLKESCNWSERIALIITIGYLFGDLPQYLLRDETTFTRVIFFVHHGLGAFTLMASIYYHVNERLMVVLISSELSTIPLNFIYLFPSEPLNTIFKLQFVLLFLGYRMGFCIPIIVRFIWDTILTVSLFDFVVHYTALIIVGIFFHAYWTYSLLAEIKNSFFPSPPTKTVK